MPARAPAFWYDAGATLWPRLLSPAATLYTAAGAMRQAFAFPSRAAVPIICVGNLVAGGAGKTPAALALAPLLRDAGLSPAFLTRGYGGRLSGPVQVDPASHDAQAVGDEPLLLAAQAPTWVSRDRAAGAAAAEQAGANIIVMDDGFQNPSLAKDLALLAIDGPAGLGNGRVIPAGPLREPAERGLARAHAIVIIGPDEHGLKRGIPEHVTVLHAALEPRSDAEVQAHQRIVAFAGIGRPEKFFATLEAIGCTVVAQHAFPDHHRFDPDEVMRLCEDAASLQAIPVTTEKDAVRLPVEARAMVKTLPVILTWSDPAAVAALLAPVIAKAKAETV